MDNLLKTYKGSPGATDLTQKHALSNEPVSANNNHNNDLELDFQVNDEYEKINENECDDINKILVKKATKACNKLIKENSELFRLNYKLSEMS